MKSTLTNYRSVIIITLMMILPNFAFLQIENSQGNDSYRTTFKDSVPSGTKSPKNDYENAYNELESMLNGSQPLDFEKAIFISENVYYQNGNDYKNFQKLLDWHTIRIMALMVANDHSDTIDFNTYTNFRERGLDYSSLRYTPDQKKELYYQALANWAIFTYLTDTVYFGDEANYPFNYRSDDPFAIKNWGHSQVLHMLSSPAQSGNCFAFAALFKILSNRFKSDAYICTAPQHIYIQHRDVKGQWYNVELPTRSFPGDGTITTLTYTFYDGIMGGLSVKKLEQAKQDIVLCLINLGKSYEHRFGDKGSDFALRCAELALQHDSTSLNAWLLKHQVLGERVLKYINDNNVPDIATLKGYEQFDELERITIHLNNKGYHEMPRYMQEMIVYQLEHDSLPPNVEDRTPNPFTSIDVPEKSRRYSTLSNGMYEEVYEKRDFENYGCFIFDVKQKQLTGIDTTFKSTILVDPVVFAWQIDPLAGQQPGWSPYVALNNSPLLFVDPGGKKVIYYVTIINNDGSVTQIRYTTSDEIFYDVYNTMPETPEFGEKYYSLYSIQYNITIDYSKDQSGIVTVGEMTKIPEGGGEGGAFSAEYEIWAKRQNEKTIEGYEIWGSNSRSEPLTRKGSGNGSGIDINDFVLPGGLASTNNRVEQVLLITQWATGIISQFLKDKEYSMAKKGDSPEGEFKRPFLVDGIDTLKDEQGNVMMGVTNNSNDDYININSGTGNTGGIDVDDDNN